MSQTRSLGRRCGTAVLVLLSAAILIPAAASANPGHFRGVVTAHTPAGNAYGQQTHPARRGSSNLTYHGGPVMHSDANYAIYWEPAGSGYTTTPTFKSIVNAYFGNVAAASGQTTNDYSVATQYYDASGNIAYRATSGGGQTDTDAYPASGCKVGTGPCITDAQLQTELNNYVTAHGLPRGPQTMYFVYFPPNVTTCFDSAGSQCSSNVYCAYHSNLGTGSTELLYADMPYAGVSGCETGQYPNHDVGADSELNVTSHENIEAITDPLGNAWYDASGNEIGDKCNFNFGSPLGGTSGSEYNEQIASGQYYLQQEWSNAASGCVQHS